jgi:maleylpyruvate isomerase
MDAALRELSDRIDDATQRLLGTARLITEPDLREPALLPGWSRGHVLAHLCRGADAMRSLLAGARAGVDRPAYASPQARADDIEQGAARQPKELAQDLETSAMALRTVSRQLPGGAWHYQVQILGPDRFPAAQLLTRRLVEVELHHADLDAGYGPADWPAAFAAMALAEPMASQRADRLSRPPGSGRPLRDPRDPGRPPPGPPRF